MKTDISHKASRTSIGQHNSRSDQLPVTSREISSGKSGSNSEEKELNKAGIFHSFKVIGSGQFSLVYDGKLDNHYIMYCIGWTVLMLHNLKRHNYNSSR
jgi:hypothetical protein